MTDPTDERGPSTALATDRYELTMLDAALRSGRAGHRAVFELFTRGLPARRGYGVVAGTARAIDAVTRFRFGEAELDWLLAAEVVTPEALDFLAGYRFSGDIWGFAEGDAYQADSPVLTVEAPFGEAVVLETVLLSIFNHDSAVASAVARMVQAAAGRPLIEGGARRAHESAAVAAARAAYLAGADATSNLEAGRSWDIPTVGTIGHAFVLAHPTEREAFEAQHGLLGSATTYLVDTFDIENGIRTAVDVAGPDLGAIRIDSGDLAVEAKRARALLDSLDATGTRIIVSGDLDEWAMAGLVDAPIDGYLVGTNLITGSGHPTASLVYKLVAIEHGNVLRSVNKRSAGKGTVGGRKIAFRIDGEDLLVVDNEHRPDAVDGPGRPLQVPLIIAGEVRPRPTLAESRDHCARALAELPPAALELDGVPPGSRVLDATQDAEQAVEPRP